MQNIREIIKHIPLPLANNYRDTDKEDLEALQARKREERVIYCKEVTNVPLRYLNARLEHITEQQQQITKKIKANINSGDIKDMLFAGSIGIGKTHLLCGLINILASKGVLAKYTTEHNLLDLFFRKEYIKFNSLKEAPFLVIDELAKRELLDWQKIQIEEIICYRYDNLLPTFYSTNQDLKLLVAHLGERVASRLRENGAELEYIRGQDLRIKKQQNNGKFGERS